MKKSNIKKSKVVVTGRRRRRRIRRPTRDGRGYPESFKKECLELLAEGHTQKSVIDDTGISSATMYRWLSAEKARRGEAKEKTEKATEKPATKAPSRKEKNVQVVSSSSRAPHDNIAGLSDEEVEAILELKREHYTMGPAQIRTQLKRFRGWRLSVKAIARVLKANGYRIEHRSAREERALSRFEAPRPNALWQMDAMSLRVHAERLYLHLIIDDYSRFIVGHKVSEELKTEVATATLQEAIGRHGKPERILTDRGGQFLAVRRDTAFRKFLESELIDHSVSRPYHPQTLGKVESVNRAIQKELIYVREFGSTREARAAIADWIEHYNLKRAHMGIDGLVPADRYFGLHQRVLAQVQARSRGRVSAANSGELIGDIFDELGESLEILRLVLVDGEVQLRFCGQRAVLGRLTE